MRKNGSAASAKRGGGRQKQLVGVGERGKQCGNVWYREG